MRIRSSHVALVILGLSAPLAPAFADGCKLEQLAELAVTMSGLRPMVATKINGADALFIADSGAFFSIITAASAAQFKLKLRPAPFGLKVEGVGGEAEISATTVDEFTLANIAVHHLEFIVGGSEPGGSAAGLLGQNVFRIADVEYDLANGAIRLMRPDEGCREAVLAYWVKSQPYSVLKINRPSAASPHTTGIALLNGARIRVVFDTGAETSILTLRAAKSAGVTLDGKGVVRAGHSYGIGRRTVDTWIAPFSSLKIGDEEIHDTRLRIGEVELTNGDMLIGADFFLSHRIYVANRQGKLYFTYNGGPVFNLANSPLPRAGTDSPENSPQSTEGAQEPADAAGFSRRGAAYAARRDFEHAIADLTRACQMEPGEAKYFYQRALARLNNRQPSLAMADLDATLKLEPDHLNALVARAELRLSGPDKSAAPSDLDAADRLAPKEANIRLGIADAYSRADLFAPAVAQYDLWIAAHKEDAKLAAAMNGRCWARALSGNDLDKALADCNAAVKISRDSAQFLDSRGLVLLRLGKFDESIADYDAALKRQPGNAWSLYGRGLDKLRKGMAPEGQADIDAAKALRPQIANEAAHYGIVP